MSKGGSEHEHPDAVPASSGEQGQPPRAPAYLSGADANLRHTLRTPLNHIIGYSELLLEEAKERGLEDMVADLQNIHTAGKELLALFNELFNQIRLAAISPWCARSGSDIAKTQTSLLAPCNSDPALKNAVFTKMYRMRLNLPDHCTSNNI